MRACSMSAVSWHMLSCHWTQLATQLFLESSRYHRNQRSSPCKDFVSREMRMPSQHESNWNQLLLERVTERHKACPRPAKPALVSCSSFDLALLNFDRIWMDILMHRDIGCHWNIGPDHVQFATEHTLLKSRQDGSCRRWMERRVCKMAGAFGPCLDLSWSDNLQPMGPMSQLIKAIQERLCRLLNLLLWSIVRHLRNDVCFAMYLVADADSPEHMAWLRNDKREFSTIPGMDSPYHSLQVGSADSVFVRKQCARAWWKIMKTWSPMVVGDSFLVFTFLRPSTS